jgi:hypothetical protein
MKKPTLVAFAIASTIGILYIAQLHEKAVQASPSKNLVATRPADVPTTLVSSDGAAIKQKSAKWRAKQKNFTMDPNNLGTIQGNEGTHLDFSTTQFVYEDGTPVTEPFTLSLEEYYQKAAMIKANLSTTSDGRQLETGGMINLRASNARGPIRLAEGSSYTIGFPKNGTNKDDFKLFYGEWRDDDLVNWKLADTYESEGEDAVLDGAYVTRYAEDLETGEKIQVRSYVGQRMSEMPPVEPARSVMMNPGETCFIQINKSSLRRDEKINKMDYFNWQLNNGQSMSQWFAGGFNPNADMVDDFCSNKLRSEITFQVDQEGRFKSYYISHSSRQEYDEAIASFLATMPPLDLRVLMPKYVVDHACILSFGSMISKSQSDFTQQFRKNYASDTTATLGKIKPGLLDHYVMSSSELGWINCDRFVNSNEMLVDYEVPIPNANCLVAMIFDNYESILRGQFDGSAYRFSRIAGNEPVHILVLDQSASTPQMAYLPGNTSSGKTKKPELKPFKLRELDALLAKPKPDKPLIAS